MGLRSAGLVTGIVVTAVAAIYLSVGCRPCLTWGATDEDVHRTMPGDELLSNPVHSACDLLCPRLWHRLAAAFGSPTWAVLVFT
jgi:hypothetical protein